MRWLSEGSMDLGHLLFQMHPSKSRTVLLNGNKKSELGLGAWAFALCPGWDRSSAWASGSDAAKFPCLSRSSSKQIRIRAEKESTADSAKGVKQRVLAEGKKKKKGRETRVGNSTAKAVSKCCPASSLLVCSALLPGVSSTLTGAWEPQVSWLRGLQDYRRLTVLPILILIFRCNQGLYYFAACPCCFGGFLPKLAC